LAVVQWGRKQVEVRMMTAMARVGLKVGNRYARKFTDIRESLKEDSSDYNIGRIYEICYGDYEGEEAKKWSSILEAKHMREMRLEYKLKPRNLRDKGGIEMCITKAKVDMVNKVWCKKGGTSLALSLKGETRLPAEMVAEKEKVKMMVKKNEGKAHRRQNGEFYLKKKVRINKTWCCPMCRVCRLSTYVHAVMQEGIWKMQYRGVNHPILKLDTIVEHDRGQVEGEEELEPMDDDDDSVLIQDLVEEEKEDDGKTGNKKKVMRIEKHEMSEFIVTVMAAQLTIWFSNTKAGDKRAASGNEIGNKKKKKVSPY
jgi:frataxin-like iron-binding protein CyaY